MNSILEELIRSLPESKTKLSTRNIKKMQDLIPVPRDYKIVWADISNFGGHPSGIVLTEEALILKGSSKDVEENNSYIRKANEGLKRKDRKPLLKEIYQIIPWTYFSPSDYSVVVEHGNNGKEKYTLKSNNSSLASFESAALSRFFSEYQMKIEEQRRISEECIQASTFSAINSYNVEQVMFNAAYGADQTKTGHGVYAEEAGVLLDRLGGETASVVGRDNAKNGPDKIVNSFPVQCKYCNSAYKSVDACFATDPITGNKAFRYLDLNNNPMKVEVPSDQYLNAIEYMKKRIAEGQVPGVTEPNEAYNIIRSGKMTYKQTVNLAKAGTIESLKYDVSTGVVNCLSVFGISIVVSFAQAYWSCKDIKKATKYALVTGLQIFGLSFASSIIASQLARTGAANAIRPLTDLVLKQIDPKTATSIINSFRALAGKKLIYGAAAQKSFAKFLGSNAITQGAMLLVFSVPDTYRIISGKLSGAQYLKNMTSLALSFGASVVGTAWAGKEIADKFGGDDHKAAKKAIGFGAGAVAGMVVGAASTHALGIIREDDSKITARLFNAVVTYKMIDYLISTEEQEEIISILDKDTKKLRRLQESIIKSDNPVSDVEIYINPILDEIVKKRETISVKTETEMGNQIIGYLNGGDLINAV